MRHSPLARAVALSGVALAAAAALGGCSSRPATVAAGGTVAGSRPAASSSTTASKTAATAARRATTSAASSSVPPPPPPPPPPPQLPLGGRTILPTYRVVAYYGGPDGPGLGVLGADDPDAIAARIEQTATQYAGFGRPVQPAMELIATVASPCASDPLCTHAIPDEDIQRYLDAAHRHHMLLVLDFQPGRGEFLPQVQADEKYLLDPSVSVALDPEWKLLPGQQPMQVIGSSSAASINAVSTYLSGLVQRANLPDKLLVVHEFRTAMLPDRGSIVAGPGLEPVVHADGFGSQAAKLGTWTALAIPNPPFHAGFKLFLTQDIDMMTPAQVMTLQPQPELITYQ